MIGRRRLYLAGPDVFLADALAVGARKVAVCAAQGFEGLFPLDAATVEREVSAKRIYESNMDMVRRSDGLIANLTPFRGVSADVGTVYEAAYALALGKPVFAYTDDAVDLGSRIRAALGSGVDRVFAGDGLVVEDFGLADNLMIAEGLAAQGWPIVVGGPGAALDPFVACLRQARAHFSDHGST